MTFPTSETIEEQALGWVIRLQHADTADWNAFHVWLAADSAHARAYWDVAAADADMAEMLSVRPLRPKVEPAVATRRRFAILAPIWGVAASVAIVATGYWALRPTASVPYAIETQAGMTRAISLEDGTKVALNGDTRLLLDHAHPRVVRLDRGEASFTVVHDAADPFRVEVGGASVRDIGTRFNIVRDGNGLRVAVAEGAVRYDGFDVTQSLYAGDSLTHSVDGTTTLRHIAPADVSAWQDRRLVYDGSNVIEVAADLSRATGLAVSVAPAIAQRPFSGSLILGEGGEKAIIRAADIMGIHAARRGDGWLLTADAPTQK